MSKAEFIKANLKKGEIYVGAIGDPAGNLHHVILLPCDNDEAPWQAQMDWANSLGGELPTRREQSLLFANLKEEFEAAWYWSGEEYSSEPAWGWFQYIGNGGQSLTRKRLELRARAVRRLIIEE